MIETVRKSVPLTPSQVALVERVREPGSPERAAIEGVVGPVVGTLSEARALSELIEVALKVLREVRLEQGYAALACASDQGDEAHARAVRARRGRLDD
ncbi:MAG: hypothetical protein LBK95_09180 [Bifidobacteriaceae bacterium]|jgi:hypothetical protein|nr:hypothetical protein [Bifidobacteriaceae bacterium]